MINVVFVDGIMYHYKNLFAKFGFKKGEIALILPSIFDILYYLKTVSSGRNM
jgi:hypothetical protein